MNKVALFDFCETLANFQTADAFVDFVREHSNSKRMLFLEKVKLICDKCQLVSYITNSLLKRYSLPKKIKLYQLRGIDQNVLNELAHDYYIYKVRPNLIEITMNKLRSLQKEGYEIYLVSGGYSIYLKYFVDEFNLDGCISSVIKFHKGKCDGTMDGPDCMRHAKVKMLNAYFHCRPQFAISFSDSPSDLPLLCWADEGVVVSESTHKKWIEKYNLNEILWYRN